MSMNFDILSQKFFAKLNFIYDPASPGIVDFIICIARAALLSYAALALLYVYKYSGRSNFNFDNSEVSIFSIIFIFFEEQARWIYSSSAENKMKSSAKFFLFIVLYESILFYVSSPIGVVDFLLTRSGSVIVHFVNGAIALFSFWRNLLKKYMIFIFAIAFHFYMNLQGSSAIIKFFGGRM